MTSYMLDPVCRSLRSLIFQDEIRFNNVLHTLVVAIHRTGDRCSSSILVRAMMVSAIAFLVTLDQASERWP